MGIKINMQGRIYDPAIGRFISADPYVQYPLWSQGLNRYSYGFNNPMSGSDPTGFGWFNDAFGDSSGWELTAFVGGFGSIVAVGAFASGNGSAAAGASGGNEVGGALGLANAVAGLSDPGANQSFAEPMGELGSGADLSQGGLSHEDRFLYLPPSGDPLEAVFGLPPPEPPAPPLAVRGWGEGSNTVLEYDGGAREVRGGAGSVAWKNNNPGNLRGSPYQIGRAHGFAVFPNETEGEAALRALLSTERYASKTIDAAIRSYAPAFENNTGAYQATIRREIGVPGSTRIDQLTESQFNALVNTIRRVEGWRPGTVVWR